MPRATRFLLFSLALAGCSEFDLINKPLGGDGEAPDIEVDPSSIEFGLLSSGETEVKDFTVRNIGAGTLNVSDIVVGTGLAFKVLGPDVTFDLEPGEELAVDVEFTPMGADENFGRVLVISDDPDTPEAPVDLLGHGAVPDLVIEPASFNFEDAFIPCGATKDLTLSNQGSEELVITALDYTSGGELSIPLAAIRSQLPIRLGPGDSTTVTVTYAPLSAGSDTGVLEVTSNDPVGVETADQNGEGAYVDEESEQFTEPGQPSVDVVMLVDQSCSMDNNQNAVDQGIPPFIAELQNLSDWQMSLIVDDHGCARGGVMDQSTANIEQLISNNVFSGTTSGAYLTERLLQLTSVALSQTGPGQCNEGMLRPGALLHVLLLSDERERSGINWSAWVADFETYVSAPDYLKVSSVVDVNSTCGDGSGPGGYLEASNYTGGSVLNICNAGWGTQLTDIASDVLAGIRTYNLSQPADPGTLVVTVNGVATTDYTYNASTNSVTINDPPVGEGDVVEVSYGVLSTCP